MGVGMLFPPFVGAPLLSRGLVPGVCWAGGHRSSVPCGFCHGSSAGSPSPPRAKAQLKTVLIPPSSTHPVRT